MCLQLEFWVITTCSKPGTRAFPMYFSHFGRSHARGHGFPLRGLRASLGRDPHWLHEILQPHRKVRIFRFHIRISAERQMEDGAVVLFDSLRYPIYTEHSTLEGTALAKRILNKGDK